MTDADKTLPVTFAYIEKEYGVNAGTLRSAASRGELYAWKRNGVWYCFLADYGSWARDGHIRANEGPRPIEDDGSREDHRRAAVSNRIRSPKIVLSKTPVPKGPKRTRRLVFCGR